MSDEIKVQVGESYRTRSGAKVTITAIKTTFRGRIIAVGDFENVGFDFWALDGSYRYMEEHYLDLVARMSEDEPPARKDASQ
jgi:hypothetical protein